VSIVPSKRLTRHGAAASTATAFFPYSIGTPAVRPEERRALGAHHLPFSSPALRSLAESDPEMIVWWAGHVECASAVHRLRS
jgi:hypothetical protein